jgi:hypothetical protein
MTPIKWPRCERKSTAADRLDVQPIALQARIGIVIALGEVDSSALEPVRET